MNLSKSYIEKMFSQLYSEMSCLHGILNETKTSGYTGILQDCLADSLTGELRYVYKKKAPFNAPCSILQPTNLFIDM